MGGKCIGESVILRPITVDDAEFTSGLRSDPKVYEFLSSSKPLTSDNQRSWIENFLSANQGYYFIIENKKTGTPEGTIGLYNFEQNSAEFGRYIALNSLSAIESEYLLLEFAFRTLNLHEIYCKTADLNTKVWKQHLSFGFKDDGFEFFEEKALLLRRQVLKRKEYILFDYSKILQIINRFAR
jgi:RimJ/RimL family protein N-acetyltransferase